MNFKRLRGIAAVALITIAAALLAGCMNSMAGSVDSSSRMATLQLSATGIPDEYAKEFAAYCEKQQRAASRSILPDDPFDIGKIDDTTSQSNGLVLVLTGKSETGMTYGPKEVTLKTTATPGVYDFDDTDGPITMESMSWNLVLTAYSDAAKTKSVLIGYCSADLRNGSGKATFVMGIAGLDTQGSVTLKGEIVDKNDLSLSYTMGIYRKDNLKDVNTTETQGTLTSNGGENEGFTFTANNVSPGTYLYIMKFYKDDTKKTIVGSFTDTIVVNPGNALKKENLVIDVIEQTPTEPDNLKAYLMKTSESSDGRTYNVKLTWDQAKYVTNYELNVVELKENGALTDLNVPADGTAIAGGQIYGMASMDDTTPNKIVKDFPGSAVFGTGSSSMMYGDESCVLKLETGKLYEIQLRARNYFDTSKWVGRKAGDSDVTGLTAYAAPDTQKINRLLVTYNLNGGTLTLGASGNTVKGTHVEYNSWTANAGLLSIVPQDGAPTSANTLAKTSGSDFAEWLLDSGTGVKDLADDASLTTTVGEAVKGYTYKNITVKASFGNKLTGNISQEDPMQDVKRGDLTVLYILGNGSSDEISETNGKYEVKRTTDGKANKIQITLANAGTDFSDDETEYTNVKFEVWVKNFDDKYTITTSAPGQCSIDLTSVTGGSVLSVMVTADTKNAYGMSQTLTFDLE